MNGPVFCWTCSNLLMTDKHGNPIFDTVTDEAGNAHRIHKDRTLCEVTVAFKEAIHADKDPKFHR